MSKTTATPSIRTSGAASMTESGVEITGFHLHRFLAGWMVERELAQLWVTVGFESSAAACQTFEVRPDACTPSRVYWSFEDLIHTIRHGDGRLRLERHGDEPQPVTLVILPLWDEDTRQQCARVIGFVLLQEPVTPGDLALEQLAERAAAAISASRRNAVRLFFDEFKEAPIKRLIYGVMEHLPEWTGCDYSSLMMLTSTLETMTMETAQSHFSVLAERVYPSADDGEPQRLVGLTLAVDREEGDLFSAAFERQRRDPELTAQVFARHEDGVRWVALDGEGVFGPYHRAERPGEQQVVLVPLVARDGAESELLGFVGLVYRVASPLAASVSGVFAELGAQLAPLLRSSSLYTLSARKLWILQSMRRAAEEAVLSGGQDDAAVERFIGEVSALIVAHVDVPSFGIAYLRPDLGPGRIMRYVHPHGWAQLDQLNLLIDVPEAERLDSGVSALAVRLRRPLVLAGGHGEGASLAFKNWLFVHEGSGRVEDLRRADGPDIDAAKDWVPLSSYYKPVRAHGYATIAYPITFGDHTLGLLTIEVDRDTNWLWWTGFGGHLFWQLVTSEIAHAYWGLGVRP